MGSPETEYTGKVRKVAFFDNGECFLSEEDENGTPIGLPWPENWPAEVTPDFVREHGFEVE